MTESGRALLAAYDTDKLFTWQPRDVAERIAAIEREAREHERARVQSLLLESDHDDAATLLRVYWIEAEAARQKEKGPEPPDPHLSAGDAVGTTPDGALVDPSPS